MDAIAIKEAAEAIKTLSDKIAAKAQPIPSVSYQIVALADQVRFQADCILNWYLAADKPDAAPQIDGARP